MKLNWLMIHSVLKFMYFAVKWEELLTLAEEIHPYTAEAMKIEVAPWIRDYVTHMDNLYTELTLEKINNKPTGEHVQKLNYYKEVLMDSPHTEVFSEKKKRFLQKNSKIPNKRDIGVNTDFMTNVRTQVRKGKKILFKGDPGVENVFYFLLIYV